MDAVCIVDFVENGWEYFFSSEQSVDFNCCNWGNCW